MYKGNCGCGHHWVEKVMSALIWISGIIFFWSSWKMTAVWGFESLYYAWVVVVLSFMSYGMKNCGCCGMPARGGSAPGGGGKMMCSHDEGCKCGDCDRCC